MGYSLSWLAIKGKPTQAICDELKFRPTGEREEIPEADYSAVKMPNGWYLIVSNNNGEQVVSNEAMQKLSESGCELVTCFVEEHVMVSSASGWKDGRMKWSVIHDCQKGESHLGVQGEPPSEFAAIRDAQLAKSNPRVDYVFDIPVETAKSVTGFRHNEDIPGLRGDVFEVLEHIAPPKRSSFKRLFGA